MSRQSLKEQERQESIEELRKELQPGDTVYTILRHVSRSGMMRVIDPVIMRDGSPRSIAHLAAKVLQDPLDRDRWGVKIGGCGMDMGFHLVYNLSYYLFPTGHGCTGNGCPSNDHSNGDRNYTPHGCLDEQGRGENREPYPGEAKDGCRRHWHTDGGYALIQKWL